MKEETTNEITTITEPKRTAPTTEAAKSEPDLNRRGFLGKTAAFLGGAAVAATAGTPSIFGQTTPQENQREQSKNGTVSNVQRRTSDYLGSLTKDNAAILMIDNQVGLISGCQSMEHSLLMNNTVALAEIGKMMNLPVVLTTSGAGGPSGPLFPELLKRYPGQEVIDRTAFFNSMQDPRFNAAVKKTGRQKLIMCGITTDLCIVYPAVTAIREGYDVYIVADACASWTKQIDDAALMRLAQAGAIPTNMQAILNEMQSNWTEQDPKAAAANQPNILKFYSTWVAPTALITNNWESQQKRK